MYNFDTVIDRSGTDSMKLHIRPDSKYEKLIHLSIADMEFETAPEVKEAIIERANHGIYGYTLNGPKYYAAVQNWLRTRHHVEVDTKWITTTAGIVSAIKNSIAAFTQPGDAVLVQMPVYHPFFDSVNTSKRKLVVNQLIYSGDSYQIDYADFEQKIIDNQVKLFILCNPHNPTGNVWTREELCRMGDICKKHDVIVVSDEIHMDFTYQGTVQTPFIAADPSFKDFCIFCSSPSKTFNLAGTKFSNIVIANEELRKQFNTTKAANGLNGSNCFAGVATVAAYTKGAAWLDELLAYIHENMVQFDRFLRENIPGMRMLNHDSLYLAWLDCKALNLDDDALKRFFEYDCGIVANPGVEFGEGGSGFMRLNLACPRCVMQEAMERMLAAAREYGFAAKSESC